MTYRYYLVECWQPPIGEDTPGHHKTFGVIAFDALSARSVVKLNNPELRIDCVNIGERVDYFPGVV